MDRIAALQALGQSIWLDNINRRMLLNGELRRMIDQGEIRGVTSNPTIFNNAISKSTDYDSAIQSMAWAGWDNEKIFWQLAIEDIRDATDLFADLYKKTSGADGYVSLEVDPRIANDGDKMLKQAETLWKTVNRPNVMIKIPGTKAGLKAIRKALAKGINVNITLIFSIERYSEVIEAYLSALEERVKSRVTDPGYCLCGILFCFQSRHEDRSSIGRANPGKGKRRGTCGKAPGQSCYCQFENGLSNFPESFPIRTV